MFRVTELLERPRGSMSSHFHAAVGRGCDIIENASYLGNGHDNLCFDTGLDARLCLGGAHCKILEEQKWSRGE